MTRYGNDIFLCHDAALFQQQEHLSDYPAGGCPKFLDWYSGITDLYRLIQTHRHSSLKIRDLAEFSISRSPLSHQVTIWQFSSPIACCDCFHHPTILPADTGGSRTRLGPGPGRRPHRGGRVMVASLALTRVTPAKGKHAPGRNRSQRNVRWCTGAADGRGSVVRWVMVTSGGEWPEYT